jgi:hypothetical protein
VEGPCLSSRTARGTNCVRSNSPIPHQKSVRQAALEILAYVRAMGGAV